MHGKLGMNQGRALELTLRTRDPRFTDAVQRALTNARSLQKQRARSPA